MFKINNKNTVKSTLVTRQANISNHDSDTME